MWNVYSALNVCLDSIIFFFVFLRNKNLLLLLFIIIIIRYSTHLKV